MAYIKQCDLRTCQRELGGTPECFFQVHGSISEQIEEKPGEVEYRYLTPTPKFKGAWCNMTCFTLWIEEAQRSIAFTPRGREFIHRY